MTPVLVSRAAAIKGVVVCFAFWRSSNTALRSSSSLLLSLLLWWCLYRRAARLSQAAATASFSFVLPLAIVRGVAKNSNPNGVHPSSTQLDGVVAVVVVVSVLSLWFPTIPLLPRRNSKGTRLALRLGVVDDDELVARRNCGCDDAGLLLVPSVPLLLFE